MGAVYGLHSTEGSLDSVTFEVEQHFFLLSSISFTLLALSVWFFLFFVFQTQEVHQPREEDLHRLQTENMNSVVLTNDETRQQTR